MCIIKGLCEPYTGTPVIAPVLRGKLPHYCLLFTLSTHPILLTVALWAPQNKSFGLCSLKLPQLFAAGLPLAGCSARGGFSAANRAQQHPCTSAARTCSVAAHRKLMVEVAVWAITGMPTHWLVPGLCYSSWSQRYPSHQCHGLPLWASFVSLLSFWVTNVFCSCSAGLCSQ